MWNDEDNNPYGGSFERRDSFTSSSANPSSPITRDCESCLPSFLFLYPPGIPVFALALTSWAWMMFYSALFLALTTIGNC